MPLLSVVLPFYNAESTIAKTIESILIQTFSDFELLCIDNNSTDSSLAIIEQFAKVDSRIRVLAESNQGVVFAHNKGCAEAKGRYIARIDSDDVACPDKFQKQIDELESDNTLGAVATQAQYIPDGELREGFSRFVDWSNSVCTYKEIILSQFIESPIIHPTAMWRREIGERYGNCKHGDFPEDYEMWLRWIKNGAVIRKIPETLLQWYDSDTRLTRTCDSYSVDAFYKIKTKYLNDWLKKNNPFYPECYVWAGGRKNSKRARLLEEYGIQILGEIDVKKKTETIHYLDIPPKEECFVLSYVANWGAREKVRAYLAQRGFIEGVNYICAS